MAQRCGKIPCCTLKPSNSKLGLYTPLLVPSEPWESVLKDFLGGLPRTRHGYDYLFVVVVRFNEMEYLIPCKKMVIGEELARLFIQGIWKDRLACRLRSWIVPWWISFKVMILSIWRLGMIACHTSNLLIIKQSIVLLRNHYLKFV